MAAKCYKKYVDVILYQNTDGKIVPLQICWNNGRRYTIDRVVSVERRASLAGGCGIRYVCMIQGQCRNLFLEKDRWFIESMRP